MRKNAIGTGTEHKSVPALSLETLSSLSEPLLASVSSSILLLDRGGRVRFANPLAETMIGYGADDLVGMEFGRIFELAEEHKHLEAAKPAADIEFPFDGVSRRGTLICNNNVRLPVRVGLVRLASVTGEVLASVATIHDLSDILQMNEYVRLMAEYDTSTCLPKMDTVLRKVEESVVRLHAMGEKFALLQIDIDHLSRIRESLGHEASASVLREIGRRLSEMLGQSDTLTRYTGDGFAVIFGNCASEEDATHRASMLMQTFVAPYRIADYCLKITASVGVSVGSDAKTTQNSMFLQAEFALRRSKSLGGNRITPFRPEMMDWHCHSVQMESQMQLALERDRFFLMYQPQVCLKTGALIGVEALLRWNSPVDGLVMPGTFIPIAEESGFIVQLGAWCLRTACREVVHLQQRLGRNVRLAVNVSPKQVHAAGFQEMVQASLESSGLPPECLEIEITEGLLMSHEDEVLRVISQLQKLGITAAIDDFGMGFSNLGYITRFKVDRLKIDRSFVGGCTHDRSSQMIIASIIFLAQSLGIEIVAEGVETEEQALILANLQCDVAQGYLYARPMTLDQVYEASKTFVVPRPTSTRETGSKNRPTRTVTALDSSPTSFTRAFPQIGRNHSRSSPAGTVDDDSKFVVTRGLSVLVAGEPVRRPSNPLREANAAKIVIC